jgi:hypothetical protein
MTPRVSVAGPARWRLAADPSATAVTSVVTALGEVSTATQHLFAAVGNCCPSGS